MVRKIPLTETQVQQLKEDKQQGMSMTDMMFKYNIAKSSIYSYLSAKDPETRPNSPVQNEIKTELIENDYLDDIFVKDDGEPEEDKQDDIITEINKNIGKRKNKAPSIPNKLPTIPDIVNDILNKTNKQPDQPQKADRVEEKQEKKTCPKKTISKISPETNDDKLERITKIINYINAFEDKLEDVLPIERTEKVDHRKKYIVSLYKMKLHDLDLQLDLIRGHIGRTTSNKTYKIGYLAIVDIIEKVGGKIVDLKGLRDDAEQNEQIDQVIKELACEYDLLSKYMKPEYRLIAYTGMQVFSTMKKNQIIKRQQDIIQTLSQDKPIDENILEKYNDI